MTTSMLSFHDKDSSPQTLTAHWSTLQLKAVISGAGFYFHFSSNETRKMAMLKVFIFPPCTQSEIPTCDQLENIGLANQLKLFNIDYC